MSYDPVNYAVYASLDSGPSVELIVSSDPEFALFSLEGDVDVNFVGFVTDGKSYLFVPQIMKKIMLL